MKQVKDRKICKKGKAWIERKLQDEESPDYQGTIERVTRDWFAMIDQHELNRKNKKKGIKPQPKNMVSVAKTQRRVKQCARCGWLLTSANWRKHWKTTKYHEIAKIAEL